MFDLETQFVYLFQFQSLEGYVIISTKQWDSAVCLSNYPVQTKVISFVVFEDATD